MSLLAKITPRTIGAKLAVANVAGVTTAAALTSILWHIAGDHPDLVVVLGAVTVGLLLPIGLSHVILRAHFRPLADLGRALATIHKGDPSQRVVAQSRDPVIQGLSQSMRDVLTRLADESLSFSAKLLGSIEAERQRIALALHDEASQTLAAGLINLDILERSLNAKGVDAAKEIGEIRTLISYGLEELNVAIYDLRPAVLDDLGLAPALRWYLKNHLTASGISITMDFDGATHAVPADVALAVMRIAQDAITNVLRHAAASRIEVRLETKPGYVTLYVVDNGCGFDMAQILTGHREHTGVGLQSMRERAELWGGTLTIHSEHQQGTAVHAVIPLGAP